MYVCVCACVCVCVCVLNCNLGTSGDHSEIFIRAMHLKCTKVKNKAISCPICKDS